MRITMLVSFRSIIRFYVYVVLTVCVSVLYASFILSSDTCTESTWTSVCGDFWTWYCWVLCALHRFFHFVIQRWFICRLLIAVVLYSIHFSGIRRCMSKLWTWNEKYKDNTSEYSLVCSVQCPHIEVFQHPALSFSRSRIIFSRRPENTYASTNMSKQWFISVLNDWTKPALQNVHSNYVREIAILVSRSRWWEVYLRQYKVYNSCQMLVVSVEIS